LADQRQSELDGEYIESILENLDTEVRRQVETDPKVRSLVHIVDIDIGLKLALALQALGYGACELKANKTDGTVPIHITWGSQDGTDASI